MSHPNHKSLVELPGNPLVSLKVLTAKATAGHAEASVVDLKIAQAALISNGVLSAKVITSRCDNGRRLLQAGRRQARGPRHPGRRVPPNSTISVPVQGVGNVSS